MRRRQMFFGLPHDDFDGWLDIRLELKIVESTLALIQFQRVTYLLATYDHLVVRLEKCLP